MRRNNPASLANHPPVSNDGARAQEPARETRPWVGRMPKTPQNDAGTRTDPPVSPPSPNSAWPAATAAAEPEEEPPGVRSGQRGLRGVP